MRLHNAHHRFQEHSPLTPTHCTGARRDSASGGPFEMWVAAQRPRQFAGLDRTFCLRFKTQRPSSKYSHPTSKRTQGSEIGQLLAEHAWCLCPYRLLCFHTLRGDTGKNSYPDPPKKSHSNYWLRPVFLVSKFHRNS